MFKKYKYTSDLCRVCLDGDSFKDIYRTMAGGDLVANLLIDLADIEVDCEETLPLPRNICDTCLATLVTAVSLQKQIRDSDKILRDMYTNLDLPTPRPVQSEVQPSTKRDVPYLSGMTDQDLYEAVVEIVAEAENNQSNPSFEPTADDEDDDDERFAEWLLPQPAVPPPEKEEVVETDRLHCCNCAESFETMGEIKAHLRDVHNKVYNPDEAEPRAKFLKHVVPCDLCGRKFDTARQMEKHKFQYKHMIACATCGTLVRIGALRAHMLRHSNEMVECEHCHKSYKKVYIYEHKAKVHCVDKKWKCDQCPDKAYASKAILKEHIKRHNPSFKRRVKAVCNVCDRKFLTKSAHRDHMFIHSGQKRFQCGHCSAAFMHLTDYKRHTWTHTGSPFTCKKCNKYMDRPSHLRAHLAAGCGTEYTGRQRRSAKLYKASRKVEVSSSEESEESEDDDGDMDEFKTEIQTESAGILTYSCGKCYDQFHSESEFAMHMTTHHGGISIYTK